MSRHLSRTTFLVFLALVFTVGLSFASVELFSLAGSRKNG
jgi:hypothetical protein